MKSVLCALDLSEVSSSVLEVALEMAGWGNAHLTILFSYRLIDQDEKSDITKLRTTIENRAREKFADLERKILKKKPLVTYEFRTEIGFLSDRIDHYIRKNPVGMIIIGQGLAESINEHKELTLQDFIRGVKIPVVIVPEEVNVTEFSK